eukprot:tig00000248_g21794.t1
MYNCSDSAPLALGTSLGTTTDPSSCPAGALGGFKAGATGATCRPLANLYRAGSTHNCSDAAPLAFGTTTDPSPGTHYKAVTTAKLVDSATGEAAATLLEGQVGTAEEEAGAEAEAEAEAGAALSGGLEPEDELQLLAGFELNFEVRF